MPNETEAASQERQVMYAVYRHFDEADRLLYVGRSRNPIARMNGHRGHSEWFTKIAKMTIEKFDSLEAATQAEADAIKAEKPAHNVQHAKPRNPRSPAPLPRMPAYDLSEWELTRRVYALLDGFDRDEYGARGWDRFKRDNPDLIRHLAATPLDGVKPMSEQSYRNWKSKNFAGYQIPNDDDVIEANSEE